MSSRPPRLSVGLPVFNGAQFLRETLDALLGQTFEDFELIISDNASTDDTQDLCRQYETQDPRIRYIRQPSNIGAARNHDVAFRASRGELFKWAGADDLFARDLFERCIGILEERPEVVLAHSWTAAIDETGRVIQALAYPLATDSPSAPVRFRSQLFGGPAGHDDLPGAIRADDIYGVVRSAVVRQVKPHDSYYHADRVFTAQLVLRGPFYQYPDWLYFRRHHSGRALQANPTTRTWCANLDPRRADRLRHPTSRLYAEYALGYVDAIRSAPLTPDEKRECYLALAEWTSGRALARIRSSATKGTPTRTSVPGAADRIDVHAVVAGQ